MGKVVQIVVTSGRRGCWPPGNADSAARVPCGGMAGLRFQERTLEKASDEK